MARRTPEVYLPESWRDTLASCLVIISLFVAFFIYAGIQSESYPVTFLVGGIYLLALWGYILLLTGKSKSEPLMQFMMVFSIAGAAVSIFLLWSVFTFSI